MIVSRCVSRVLVY